jgi:hypothetical protein
MPGRYLVAASRLALPLLPTDPFMRTPDNAYLVASMNGQSPGLPHISETIAVDTMRGGETSGTAITLRHTQYARVSGSVIDSNGRPAASSLVTIRPAHSEGLPGRRAAEVFANAGRFTFSSVPLGEYRLTTSVQSYSATPPRAPISESAAQAISVHEDITGLVVRTQITQPQVTATGRVFIDGAPTTTARVQVMSWSRDENAIAPEALSLPASFLVTRANGWFGFGGGDSWFALRHAGSPALALKSVTAGGVDVTDGFDMKRAAGTFEVHLTSQVSTISGVVKDADGGLAAGCDVVVFSDDPSSWRVPFSRRVVLLRADDKGMFELTGLPSGQYLAVAPAGLDRATWADPGRLERWRAVAIPLSIIDGEKTTIALKRN